MQSNYRIQTDKLCSLAEMNHKIAVCYDGRKNMEMQLREICKAENAKLVNLNLFRTFIDVALTINTILHFKSLDKIFIFFFAVIIEEPEFTETIENVTVPAGKFILYKFNLIIYADDTVE
jgi:hypothetical protein